MAYIDRDKLIERLVNTPSECCKLPQTIPFLNGSAARQNEIIDLIEAEPAADVKEVVHGEWIENRTEFICSACIERVKDEIVYMVQGEILNFCPNCGADMRGEKDG